MSTREFSDLSLVHAALDAVDDAVEISDASGRFIYVNPRWEKMTGYSRAEAIGESPRTLLRAADAVPGFFEAIDRALRDGLPWAGELRSRRKDGTLLLNYGRVIPIRKGGELANIVAVRHDLAPARETARRLAASEARFERTVRAANEGLWEADMATRTVWLSPRCSELVAARSEHPSFAELTELVHPDDREWVIQTLQAGLSAPGGHQTAELRVLDPQKSWRWVLIRGRVHADDERVTVAGGMSDIQDRKNAELALVELARRDPLTALHNRRAFVERVDQARLRAARTPGPAFAVLFIDLRRFKMVNDQHGHLVGDELLRAVGTRLVSAVRPGDVVARLGGDEFAVLLEPLYSEARMRAAAARVERMLGLPFDLGDRTVTIAGTVGGVLGDGDTLVDELIRDADAAMYIARAEGRSGHLIADAELRAKVHRRAQIGAELPQALRRRELTVAIQPIVSLPEGRPTGAEALARWTHASLGPVGPAEFVAIADELDLGTELGIVVVELALSWLVRARAAHVVDDVFVLHVNASARQLQDPRFVDALELMWRTSMQPPRTLAIEVTETVLIDHPDAMARVMERLMAAGISFALDDFGTGWSSLSHLRRFPVACLKIDRTFTRAVATEPVTAAIVRGLLSMAEAMKIETVAEGVETQEEVAAIASLGVTRAQGYYFARPVPGDEATRWLQGRGR